MEAAKPSKAHTSAARDLAVSGFVFAFIRLGLVLLGRRGLQEPLPEPLPGSLLGDGCAVTRRLLHALPPFCPAQPDYLSKCLPAGSGEGLKLIRFRGQAMIGEKGVHDAEITPAVSA